MAWIGIECSVDAHDLEKWALHVRKAGAGSVSGEGVADLLLFLLFSYYDTLNVLPDEVSQ